MFQIYKSGQAKTLRLLIAFLIQAFIIYGSYQLYLWLNFTDDRGNPLWVAQQIGYSEGLEMEITPRLLISIGFFVFASLANFFFNNSQRFSEFLIDVQSELTKVSWASREEVVKSTVVVLFVTLVLMIYIAIVDQCFSWMIKSILG
ncbi:MAG: preprotein translocase subunit SecE [Planctomycetota bacterium]|nr:MAG: preprotein translocase subunit SecE [Planctomycetota bacterium]